MNESIYNALRGMIPEDSDLGQETVLRTLAEGVFIYLCQDGWGLEKYRDRTVKK